MPITPSRGSTGGGTTVTITGTSLGGATAVQFDNNPAVITANTATSVTVTTPAGQGVAEVTVTTPGGTSGIAYFMYIPTPYLRSVSPASGGISGGNTITILGAHLSTATSVAIGGTPVAVTVVSDSQLTAVTPAHAAGAVTVAVTTIGGIADEITFTYVAAPTLTSFTPITGSTGGGTTVTLNGTNLLTTTGVGFGGTPAQFGVISGTRIAATAPPHALGTVSLSVTTTGGNATAPGTYLYVL